MEMVGSVFGDFGPGFYRDFEEASQEPQKFQVNKHGLLGGVD